MSDRPYFRFYYVDFARDYAEIYRDNDAFSTYIRLGAVAEAMWPSVPEVPRSEKSVHVKRLIEATLVRLIPPFGFEIKGMDAERTARSIAARNAARSRWGNADGHADAMPSRAEPSLTKPSLVRPHSKNGVDPTLILDERELSEEEQTTRRIAAQVKLTGVDAS